MKSTDWLLLLSLFEGKDKESPPINAMGGNPFRGLWTLFKIFVFLFLLIWFLFHQKFISLQIKPGWEERRPQSQLSLPEPDGTEFYIVHPGETLSQISEQTGYNQRLLMSVNRLENPHRVYAGQRLVLPKQNRAKSSRQ